MFTAIIPKIPFMEKRETVDFYVSKLYFKIMSDYGDYLLMEKEGLEIHSFHYPELIKEKSDFMLYIRVSDIENLYVSLQEHGVNIHSQGKLEAKPWGQKEFSVIDPAGTLLTFGA